VQEMQQTLQQVQQQVKFGFENTATRTLNSQATSGQLVEWVHNDQGHVPAAPPMNVAALQAATAAVLAPLLAHYGLPADCAVADMRNRLAYALKLHKSCPISVWPGYCCPAVDAVALCCAGCCATLASFGEEWLLLASLRDEWLVLASAQRGGCDMESCKQRLVGLRPWDGPCCWLHQPGRTPRQLLLFCTRRY
jgi:hypothetical protein